MLNIVVYFIAGVVMVLFLLFISDALLEGFLGFSLLKKLADKLEDKSYVKKLKRLEKESKGKIKRHNKKKDTINYDTLKYEYKNLLAIVKVAMNEVDEIDESSNTNDLYILKLDEYFRKIKKKRNVKNCSIEGVACLVKAIMEEPIVSDQKINEKILVKLFDVIKACGVNFSYNNQVVNFGNEDDMLKAIEDFLEYKDSTFLIAALILK